MYVYFDENGTLKELISLPVRQGNYNYDTIYVYWENKPIVKDYWVTYMLPDKTKTNEYSVNSLISKTIPEVKNRDLKFFQEYKSYEFLRIKLPDEVLAQNGLVLCSVRAVLNDGSFMTLGMITFEVEQSVIKEDNLITMSQYNYLLYLMENQEFAWNDFEQFIGLTRDQVKEDGNVYNYIIKKIEAEYLKKINSISEEELNEILV